MWTVFNRIKVKTGNDTGRLVTSRDKNEGKLSGEGRHIDDSWGMHAVGQDELHDITAIT